MYFMSINSDQILNGALNIELHFHLVCYIIDGIATINEKAAPPTAYKYRDGEEPPSR